LAANNAEKKEPNIADVARTGTTFSSVVLLEHGVKCF
jgi:hypothetical protein